MDSDPAPPVTPPVAIINPASKASNNVPSWLDNAETAKPARKASNAVENLHAGLPVTSDPSLLKSTASKTLAKDSDDQPSCVVLYSLQPSS